MDKGFLSWRWGCLILVIIISLIFPLTVWLIVKEIRGATTGIVKVEQKTEKMFFENTRFLESRKELILAKKHSHFRYIQSDSVNFKIPLWGDAKSEATYKIYFNAECPYGVDMSYEKWKFQVVGDVLFVTAPQIKPLNVSIDTASIEAFSDNGYLLFNEKAKLEAMNKELSSYAFAQAKAQKNISAVRETVRMGIENLVYEWAGKSFPYKSIQVKFVDENDFPRPWISNSVDRLH